MTPTTNPPQTQSLASSESAQSALGGVLRNKAARILTLVLLAQGGLFYAVANRGEFIPTIDPLATFPARLDNWVMVKEGYVDEETQAVLKADDTLTRVYAEPSGSVASLFIAFFKTQRTGKAPHSPKNCLPGSGWETANIGTMDVQVPGLAKPITVNKYVVVKGEYRSVVLYWYQSRDRVVASEYAAKVWTVADSMRLNRSDTSLVRIVVPVTASGDEAAATAATEFVKSMYPSLRRKLPA